MQHFGYWRFPADGIRRKDQSQPKQHNLGSEVIIQLLFNAPQEAAV